MASPEKPTYIPATKKAQRRLILLKALGGHKTIGALLEKVTAQELKKSGIDPTTLRPFRNAA